MNRIRKLRKDKKMLQIDVANSVGKSERMIGFYESGERDPNTGTLARLADLFDCTIDYLLYRTDTKNATVDVTGLTNEQTKKVKEQIEKFKSENK